jgi:glutaryl-CoA dehydrogenase
MCGMTASTQPAPAVRPDDFLELDALLSDEERDIRDTVRRARRTSTRS